VAGKAGRVGFSVRPQRRVDRFEHALQILIDVGIPEPQHAKSFSHEIAVAALIPRSVVVKIVLPAVDFNGELMPHAYEIHDVAFPRRLTPEMKSTRTP